MKIPPHQFEATVAFYRDIVRLPYLGTSGHSEVFEFGPMRLWLDRVPTVSQAELWLELQADDPDAALRHLQANGVVRCDAIEPLPAGFVGGWIINAAGIVHLVTEPSEAAELRTIVD